MSALPLALVLSLGACNEPAPEVPAVVGPTEPSAADAEALLAPSWAAALSADAAGIQAVLDGPGGEGWIALFHGDLTGAARIFEAALEADPKQGAARLGLFRVHLARADAYAVAADLHLDAARELATYRAQHRDRVRLGPYERRLARLIFPPGEAPTDSGGEPSIAGELSTVAALDALATQSPGDAPPRGLPEGWAAVRTFAQAVAGADLVGARASQAWVTSGEPDLVDPLGLDEDTGLRFESQHFDPARLPALASFHALEALRVAGAVPGLEGPVAAMCGRFLSLRPSPDALAALPERVAGTTAPPALFLTFAGPWVDPSDLTSSAGAGQGTLAAQVVARLPQWFGGAPTAASIDRELRAVELLEGLFAARLGEGLAADLQASRLLGDAILRRRMVDLSASHPTLALRLGRRSLDANAGALGGPASSSRTRVSYRNDRGFLLRLARQLWKAGQPGEALDLVHPLAQEDRALQPVVHYLGQLDAASSVGTAGKASQL